MEKFFKLKQNHTDVRTEVMAGIATFMTMAYILSVNPVILAGGQDQKLWNAVFMATAISAFIGTILMSLYANKPFALAPGMGLNAFFVSVITGMVAAQGISYQEAFEGGLAIVFFSGVLFTVLTLLKIDNVIEKDFLPVHPEMSLKEMVDVISHSNRNLFPVTDEGGTLLGIVLLDDIRNIMFRPDLYRKIYVSKFMTAAPAKIEVGETMDAVMKKFDDTNAWNLPVVENGKYVGFVSKSKIFNSYRRVLKHYTDD